MKSEKPRGRPEKPDKKDRILALKCSSADELIIRSNASLYNLPVSVYIRDIAVKHRVQLKKLPQEVLVFQTRINQTCSLLNQLARKKNKNEQLSAIDRAQLSDLVDELFSVVKLIKSYLDDNQRQTF